MLCPRLSNSSINKLKERALRMTKDDQHSNFQDLISKYKELPIHQKTSNAYDRNINSLSFFFFLFHENVHNIQNFHILSNNTKKTGRYGLDTVPYGSPFLRANIPQGYKFQTSLHSFKALVI